jgi:signal transduction histidine kinase
VRFRSLRWRIASFYAILLLVVIAVVAGVLAVELRSILLDEARGKIDSVGSDIAQLVQGESALSAIGDTAPIETDLLATGALDHWSGPTTFVEIDTADGYPVAKSTNMGGAIFPRQVTARSHPIEYRAEKVPALGNMLVRDQLIHYPGVAFIVKVGESLDIYDETFGRVRVLLAIVVVVAALVVVAGSFAIAKSALEPIGRLGAAMGEIRSDRLSSRLGWSERRDELGSLAQSFDAMLDRLEDGFVRERQFISDASHELKTPLTVINANAQMLERWADRDPQIRRDSLHAIAEESSALAAMVNGMLLLGRAESGDGIPREPVALATVIGEAVGATLPRAHEKGLALGYAPPSDLEANVNGDAALLRQLFTNLIDNAIKFTDSGRIDVALQANAGSAVVTVADTGIGIDDAALGRVFDRFYRTDASRNRAVPGTGLGLAIVRSIARVHDGTVEAVRRPEGGTTFRVTLPLLTPFQ